MPAFPAALDTQFHQGDLQNYATQSYWGALVCVMVGAQHVQQVRMRGQQGWQGQQGWPGFLHGILARLALLHEQDQEQQIEDEEQQGEQERQRKHEPF